MRNYETADFYTDATLVDDPHAYFHFLRDKGPVVPLPRRGVVAVMGYEETVQVMLDTEHFSSINAVTGPIPGLPFEVTGDDISAQLEANRSKIPFADQIVTEQGERHSKLRSITARLFTPSRLKALEPKLRDTADALIDEFAADGRVDLVKQFGGPYATLVIADLLGVPDKARRDFRNWLEHAVPAEIGAEVRPEDMMNSPFARIGKAMFKFLTIRRVLSAPPLSWLKGLFGVRDDDILTEIALARYPDGSKPGIVDITALSAFMFGAGQDTTNRLLANGFRVIATRPDIQQALRDEPARIPDFIEELLRYDGSVKSGGRMCQKSTTVGGVEIKAGTTILLSHMAANRDPRRFADPDRFDMDRPKLKEHLAFGRGAHTCVGAPLARREVAVSIERLLARMGNIRLSPAHHGAQGDTFDYEPTYILRAMRSLHLEFDPL
jgi:cytochrome P450